MADMNKKKDPVKRVDISFFNEMKDLAKFRYMKNLERKEPSFAEMTRLLRRTDAWKQGLFELKNKPRKESLG